MGLNFFYPKDHTNFPNNPIQFVAFACLYSNFQITYTAYSTKLVYVKKKSCM